MSFQVDHAALQELLTHRLGRTLLLTNRRDWTAEQVVAAYASQQELEQVFRGLKEGDWLNWQPMHHWTDSKIRVHAFYCLLGLSLLHYVLRQAHTFWPQLTVEKLQEELEQIQQFVLLYPGPGRRPASHRHGGRHTELGSKRLGRYLRLGTTCVVPQVGNTTASLQPNENETRYRRF